MKRIGGFRTGFDGAQDYDLFLRFIERTHSIAHIPKILYHWRQIQGSVASGSEAKPYAYVSGHKALAEYLARQNMPGTVMEGSFVGSYRIRRFITATDKVSIIIPFRDKSDLLRQCVSSILEKTDYLNYEIILVNNGSTEALTREYLNTIHTTENIHLLNYNKPFNYSAINNYAVTQATGRYVLLLNNDTEVIAREWLSAMVEHCQREEVGVVGAKLLYPNDTIQHAGVIMGIGTGVHAVAGHAFRHFSKQDLGYFGFTSVIRNYSAVTGACMLMRRSVYEELGGLDEVNVGVAYNDVDLCLRAVEKGYLVVYTPYALLYHHESASRGSDASFEQTNPSEFARVTAECRYMQERWKAYLNHDPLYSTHLTRDREDFGIRIWDETL